MNKRNLGVIIARFQTPSLTAGHQYLLSQVATRCSRALVLLGVAAVPCLKRNPLEYGLRARMVEEWWAVNHPDRELTVLPLHDCSSNEEWAARIDAFIAAVNVNGPATVYSGRDGAGLAYQAANGRWPMEVLDSIGGNASQIRADITPRYTEDFRAGAIYSIERDYIRPRVCIDVIICDGDKMLLAHKRQDSRKDGREWRLVGGFVDVRDASLEMTVKREVLEETGLEISEPMYVGSSIIDDWRYRNGPEAIMTTLFSCQRVFGEPKANDDIDAVRWFDKADVQKVIHPVHADLLTLGLKVQ